MTEELLEHKWNEIRLNGNRNSSDVAAAQQQSSVGWYNQYVTNEGDRKTKLQRFNQMDVESVEISRALDIMAEDASSSNYENADAYEIDFDDRKKVKKTHIRLIEDMKDLWEQRTELGSQGYEYIREAIKYGFIAFKKKRDGTLQKIRQEAAVGYVLSPEDENIVTHYVFDFDAPRLKLIENHQGVDQERLGNIKTQYASNNSNYSIIPIEDLLILKVGNGPFGKSILERVYGIWRKLQLLEDSVVIYRVVRAPERRVFYIDVGRLPEQKHETVINKYRAKLRQKQIMKNGELTSEFDPHSTTEDFFLPVTGTGRSSRIETLQGGGMQGQLDDLNYYVRKLAKGLRVPPSMIDTQNADGDRDTFSDARVGQVYQVEVRYMGYIKRLKKPIEEALRKHFCWFCREREVIVPPSMRFFIKEAQSFKLYKDLEVTQARLNVMQSLGQMEYFSKRFAMQEFMKLSEEEILDNELAKLREKGLDDKQIKEIPQQIIENIVYGDGSKGADYGIKQAEGGGRAW